MKGATLVLLASARRRSKKREQECSLTYDDVLDILWEQGGRCFYSGVPLEFAEKQTCWRWSLERLDTTIGYVRGNTALVACEFNRWSFNR